MSDKNLTEAEWKKFAKGRDLKDAALLKALAAYEKAREPQEQLKALAALEKEADALRKFVKGDKDFGAQLDGIDKAIAKEEKLARAAQKEAEQKESESGEDEEESPALLTSKMVPLLRQVKKGEEMQVLIASLGKEVAVLMSRRAISPSRRKLLSDYLDGSGTPKFFPGSCVFEEQSYTFVLKTQAAGLAKRIKAALLAQVELRLKVRVRGEDGELDDDGEPAEQEGGEQGSEEPDAPAPQAPGQPAPQGGTVPPAPPLPQDALKVQFEQRLAELEPQTLAALKAQQGDASKIRAVAEFAREKGATGQYKAGLQALESLAKLLPGPQQPPAPREEPPAPTGPDPAARFNARLAQLLPQVQAAIKAAGPQAQDIKLKTSEAGVFARKKEFERAHDLLDEVLGLLESPAPRGGESEQGEDQQQEPPAPGGARADYEALLARFEPEFLAATGGSDPALATLIAPLRAAWDMAQDNAAAGNHERALLILKRLAEGSALKELQQARRDAPAPGGKTGPSLVAQRKFMLTRWARIPAELRVELDELSSRVEAQGGDEGPQELAQAIGAHLEELLDSLQDQLDDAINAGDMASFKGLRSRVEQDELVRHLDAAPFMDGSKFKRAVFAAMDEIEAALTA